MRWLLASALAVLVASAAPACINDREVETHEREFKSQYLAPQPYQSPDPPRDAGGWPLAAAGGGLILLAGAAVIAGRSV